MSERIINSAWRFVLVFVIFILGAAGMFQIYQGMLGLLGESWRSGLGPVAAGTAMAAAVYWLARHRGDLIDL